MTGYGLHTTPKAAFRSIRVEYARPITALLACTVLLATTSSDRLMAHISLVPSFYSIALCVAISILLLPARWAALGLPLAAGVTYGLAWLSELKTMAIGMPITALDVEILFTDPSIVANALGFAASVTGPSVTTGLCLIGMALSVGVFRQRGSISPVFGLVSVVTLIVALGIGATCLKRYALFAHNHARSLVSDACLDPGAVQCQAALSRRIGVVEYVAHTYFAGGAGMPTASAVHAPVSQSELRTAATKFLNATAESRAPLAPNIVFFHAESTFDPNHAFRLNERIEIPLWSAGPSTRAAGPLRVNVIGGGTWVTEFEVLTGVDSRLFGYMGYYTHTYLAPMVRNSFPRYLSAKGYRTAAYYSVEGHVFNAEPAFSAYGFDEFVGGRALGLQGDWATIVDRDIGAAVIAHGAFERPGPFFYLINTNENHGPHPCRSDRTASSFPVMFERGASQEQTCAFHEYLRRARSTSDAFEMVAEELKAIERETGRPYVLLAYGDHQPWSFTDGLYSVAGGVAADSGVGDFSALRTTASGYMTFFHLQASGTAVLKQQRFAEPPPATLLPVLASAFVASSEDDLYMPLNLLAFSKCGSDLRHNHCSSQLQLDDSLRSSLFTRVSR